MGRGVSGCATCDGFFFKDKRVAVVGGGDTAMEEALFLTRYAGEVLLIHRRDTSGRPRSCLTGPQQPQDHLRHRHGRRGDPGRNVRRGRSPAGTSKTGEEREIAVDGFFAAIGHEPATRLFKGQIEMDEEGYVLQHEHTMTNVPGVFAAGDVSDKRYRQAVTAAGDGCMAAIDAERWLESQGEAEHAEDPTPGPRRRTKRPAPGPDKQPTGQSSGHNRSTAEGRRKRPSYSARRASGRTSRATSSSRRR